MAGRRGVAVRSSGRPLGAGAHAEPRHHLHVSGGLRTPGSQAGGCPVTNSSPGLTSHDGVELNGCANIVVADADRIRTITIDRPEAKGAMRGEMWSALGNALADAQDNLERPASCCRSSATTHVVVR